MRTILFVMLLVAFSTLAVATPTLYGPNGIVTYPTAGSDESVISVTPYVMTYGGDEWIGMVTANVDLKFIEAYGSVSVYNGKDFSVNDFSTYGAKVKVKAGEKFKVAAGATMFTGDRVDIYTAVTTDVLDLKLTDFDLTGGINYQTTTDEFAKGDTRIFVGATTRVSNVVKIGAEASVPLNGPNGVIYSLGASADVMLFNVTAGLTNNMYGYKSDDMGYFVNMGYSFNLL